MDEEDKILDLGWNPHQEEEEEDSGTCHLLLRVPPTYVALLIGGLPWGRGGRGRMYVSP